VRQFPPAADDFVRLPLPLIAAAGEGKAAVAAAARQYEQQAKVVDTRLFRKITLQVKGMSLADFCAQMQEQTGVELRASRIVADEKVTVFVKDERARDVMRAVARLFGYLWTRSGEESAYRYKLDQDMRSQLFEEELRNHDQNAALLALDAEMQKYRPFLDVPYAELKKSAAQNGQPGKPPLSLMQGGRWGGAQLYFHLAPRSRAALTAGQELVFSPDASDKDLRFPAEWNHPILESMGDGPDNDNRLIPISQAPGVSSAQVCLRLDRFELGEASLMVKVLAMSSDRGGEARWTVIGPPLAVGRSFAVANPDNRTANGPLRGHEPFEKAVSLRPRPSCAAKNPRSGQSDPQLELLSFENDPLRSYAFSADVWEAVHQVTGLPIVADFYTHLYPLGQVTVERDTLYEALCTVGDALGVRWRKEGDFLLCRSANYFWDKLKEVPNRYLHRWAQDRNAKGGLPLEDFLEMATMTDQQLDSGPVAEGIQRAWGLPEWGWLSRHFSPLHRYNARCLALLTSDQLRRTLEPAGLPFRELTPTQQQGLIRLEWAQYEEAERRVGGYTPIRPDLFADSKIYANYIPAGCYVALVAPESMDMAKARSVGLVEYVGGRTVPEARANADRLRPGSSPVEIRRARDGYFDAGIRFAVGRP
jgi:hypothetical protein